MSLIDYIHAKKVEYWMKTEKMGNITNTLFFKVDDSIVFAEWYRNGKMTWKARKGKKSQHRNHVEVSNAIQLIDFIEND